MKGTVIIHCLAGMHRAPCILVSHILYRYFKKNQKFLEIDFDKIYKNLSAIRGFIDILINFSYLY